MTPDASTPCPACPVHVRTLYASAKVVLGVFGPTPHAGTEDTIAAAADALEQLRFACEAIAPFIDAHQGNHDHALSVELAGARFPQLGDRPRGSLQP